MDHSWLKLVHKIVIPQIGDIIFRTTVNILKIAGRYFLSFKIINYRSGFFIFVNNQNGTFFLAKIKTV